MRIDNWKLASVLVLVVAVSAGVFGQGPQELKNEANLKSRLQQKLDEWRKSAKFSGATLGICMENGECFSLATGYSDRTAKTPMKPDDIMLAGSVGKTYVAAVALKLIGEGRIGLDDKISKYFGKEKWFPRLPNSSDITVRQLMSHTSGLVRYEFNPNFLKDLAAEPQKYRKPVELISYLFDSKAPFEAGKGWDYSDTNFIVLGMIIEKVTGKKYYDLAVKNVLEPLKLKRTKPQDGPVIKGLIQGYAGAGNPFGGFDEMIRDGKFVINPQFEWTGGGMASTSGDLAKWAKAMYEARAFKKEMLDEMLKGIPAPMLGQNVEYGLGVIIRPTLQGLTYGHSGFFPGYMTDVMYFPEKKMSLAVQVNSSVPRDLGKPLGRVLVEMAAEMASVQ
ncbi:MAG TPA: serine hydrolase domain-containing protein [Aridibacter sp.]|nr:serine hydrolase domain-containing protein [Aridibacter sp.]